MKKYYYDLHIHSCLSPCGDNDSTPDSIMGMGELNGLDILALTDHNTLKNCPAFFKAAERHKKVAVAGVELTTAEDILIICLFETLEGGMKFDKLLEDRRILIKNRKDIFGEQLITDEFDEIIGEEENLLINATTISLDEVKDLVEKLGGVCYPAHIDRESNGIIAVLGAIPAELGFTVVELHDSEKKEKYSSLTGFPADRFVSNSDAHNLWDIKDKSDYLYLDADENNPDEVRKKLFEYLRGSK